MTTQTFGEWAISRLRAAGAYGGAYDGAEGREYFDALKRYQAAEGLNITGKADEDTVARLRLVRPLRTQGAEASHVISKVPPKPLEPIWMRDARRYIGVTEIPGPKSNPTIMSWAKRFGGWIASYYTDDDIPWCGLFIGHVIATTLPTEPMPANPLGALNWRRFGIEMTDIAVGTILVFERKGGGHVGIYVGEDRTHYHVLGANQNNAVNITRIEKSRLVAGGKRWPKTGEAPIGGAVWLTASGAPLSKSEA
ncbi:hypothetical protein A6U96_09340 [Agrobacterium tumefaciens]|nr:hypothetical protein A6U96_09340 [Agrobacterium tumefaciens]